jgi:hypothetical protein
MDRATDCDDRRPMGCWPGMPDFADLKARIAALCARASSPQPDARLLVEIEDLLAEGYVCALHGDHLTRRLQNRFEALMDSADGDEQLRSVAREQRMVAEATRELRAELAVMREHWIALGSERIGLA